MTTLQLENVSRWAAARVKEARTGLLLMFFVALASAALVAAHDVYEVRMANHAIRALARNEDVAVDPRTAPGEVLIARLVYALKHGRRDEAQALADMSRGGFTSPPERARLLTLLANSRVRAALSLIEAGRHDEAIPEVRLAKDAYREAMRLEPSLWDAKYNFDVAMRLVRDLPEGDADTDEVPPDAPKRLWTDLPGVPRGLP